MATRVHYTYEEGPAAMTQRLRVATGNRRLPPTTNYFLKTDAAGEPATKPLPLAYMPSTL